MFIQVRGSYSEKSLTYIHYRDINNRMEERVINILLDIKADIGGLKKDVGDLKEGQQRLEGRMDRLEGRMDNFEGRMDNFEGRMDVLEADMSEVKTTVNALAEGLLETSREVKQIKGKSVHA